MKLFSFFHKAKPIAVMPTAVSAQPDVAATAVGVSTIASASTDTAAKEKGAQKKEAKKVEKKTPKQKSELARGIGSLRHMGLGKHRDQLIQNLAILLNAGLTITESLATINEEIKSRPMKRILSEIIEDVENGSPLWRAFDKQEFFSPYTMAMIRIGEEAGALAKNMEYLAEQQEKDRALRQKVKMAMIYPGIVLTLTIFLTLGLAWFVLPKLVTVLTSLDAELPWVTKAIIWIADFFSAHGVVAVPLFLTAMFLTVLLCKFTFLKGPTQRIIFKIPGIGTLGKHATIARFGVILGSLIQAGVPLLEAIRSLAEVTEVVAYKKFYKKLAKQIEVGQSFRSAFHEIKNTSKIFPISVQQLIITGEKSGSLSGMLMKISEIYEKKAEETAQKLPVVLEPMLLFFIGGIVGTVAFAIIVPIYSIVGSVGR